MYYFFFFKQKTAYELRISDWSSAVCSSDLARAGDVAIGLGLREQAGKHRPADVVHAAAEARRLHGFAGSQRIAAEDFGGTDGLQVIRVLGLAADRMHRVAGAAEDVDRQRPDAAGQIGRAHV